jgi:hypothetical protein
MSWLNGVIRTDGPNSDCEISNYRWISPDYLSSKRISLLRGRLLTDADRTLKSALISERTANTVWPDQDPIGHQFRRGGNGTYTLPEMRLYGHYGIVSG